MDVQPPLWLWATLSEILSSTLLLLDASKTARAPSIAKAFSEKAFLLKKQMFGEELYVHWYRAHPGLSSITPIMYTQSSPVPIELETDKK